MDISYAVQQLDREIALTEQQLSEKKAARKSLYSALTGEQKKTVDEALTKLAAQLKGQKPPPPIGT